MPRSSRLASSRDFGRALARGARSSSGAVNCAVLRRDDDRPLRLGVTATKRVGGAVKRNRAKRRIREAAAPALKGRTGVDVVFSARLDAVSRDFQKLEADVARAFEEALARC